MQSETTPSSAHSKKADVKDDQKDFPQTETTIGRVWYKCARCHQAFDDKDTLMTHIVSFCFVFHLVLKGNSTEIPEGIEKQVSSKSNNRDETSRTNAPKQNGVESNDSTVKIDYSLSQVKKIQRVVKTPGICPICNKQLSNELLSRHMRVHTGELPYACSKCSLTFSQGCSLTRHLLTHKKGEKLLNCDQCDNRYRSVRDLNRHLKLHSLTGDVAKELLLKCRVCSLEYRTKRGLREHEKTHGSLAKDYGSSDSEDGGKIATSKKLKKTTLVEKRSPRHRKRRSTTVRSYAEESLSSSDEENLDQRKKRDNKKRKRRMNSIESESEQEEDLSDRSGDKQRFKVKDSQKETEKDREKDAPRNSREITTSCVNPQSPTVDAYSGKPINNTSEYLVLGNINNSTSAQISHNSENLKPSNYPMVKCNVCSFSYERTVQGYHDHVKAHHWCERGESKQPVSENVEKEKGSLPDDGERNKRKRDLEVKSQKRSKVESVDRQASAKGSSSEEEQLAESDVTSEPSTDASSLCMDSEFDSDSTYRFEGESESTDHYGIDSPVREKVSYAFHKTPDAPINAEKDHAVSCNSAKRTAVTKEDVIRERAKLTSEVNLEDRMKMRFAKIVLRRLNCEEIEKFGWLVPDKEEQDESSDDHDHLHSNSNEWTTFDDVEDAKPEVVSLHLDEKQISLGTEVTDTQRKWRGFVNTANNAFQDSRDPSHLDSEGFRGESGACGGLSEMTSIHPQKPPVIIPIKREPEENDHANLNSVRNLSQSSDATFDRSATESSTHVRENHSNVLALCSNLQIKLDSLNEGSNKNDKQPTLAFVEAGIVESHECSSKYWVKTEPISDDEDIKSNEQERLGSIENDVEVNDGCSDLQVKSESPDEADMPYEKVNRLAFLEANTVELQGGCSDMWLKTEPLSDDEDSHNNDRQSTSFNKDGNLGFDGGAELKTDLDRSAQSDQMGYPSSSDSRPKHVMTNLTAANFSQGYRGLLDVSERFAVESLAQSKELNLGHVIRKEDRNEPPSCLFEEPAVACNVNGDHKTFQQNPGNMASGNSDHTAGPSVSSADQLRRGQLVSSYYATGKVGARNNPYPELLFTDPLILTGTSQCSDVSIKQDTIEDSLFRFGQS